LPTALRHPGDKSIKEGEDIRKIRQPGGYYSTGRASIPSAGSQAEEAENRFVQRGLKISPLLLPCCVSPSVLCPTALEAVPRYWSEPSACCKGAASDSEEAEPLLSYAATPVFSQSHWVAVVLLNSLWCLAGALQATRD